MVFVPNELGKALRRKTVRGEKVMSENTIKCEITNTYIYTAGNK